MSDYLKIRVSGATLNEFANAYTAALESAPPDVKKRLHTVRTNYLGAYGLDGFHKKLNNLTVKEILDKEQEAQETGRSNLITEGEVDGLRFKLFDAPKKKD